jgi:tRNA-(ms[2]io[6]A)-hydroxylase
VAPGGDSPKRRLPLLQGDHAKDPEAQERPPWHWSAIGAVAIFLAWLPLIAAAHALGTRMLQAAPNAVGAPGNVPRSTGIAVGALYLLTFALAAFASGFLVGRFGGKAGRREAAVGGLLASALAGALSVTQEPAPGASIWAPILLVFGSVGTGFAFLGGHVGLRRRPLGE